MHKVIVSNEPVFFLHMRKYSETSAILECFSQRYGRFSVLGQGILRSTKKKTKERPRIFQAYLISATVRSELGVLTSLESNHLWSQPVGEKWYVANYLNEMLLKLLPKLESVPELYQQYVKTLDCLTTKQDFSYQLMLFEKTLLESLGYGIDMKYEAKTREFIQNDLYYEFDPQVGFIQCDEDYMNSVSGSTITALCEKNYEYFLQSVDSLKLMKKIIRMSLKYQLGDVKLKTVTVMREVDQFAEVQ